jgi:ParB family chromosome partitioning protein
MENRLNIEIDNIKIGKRVRKDVGDLTNLKASLQKYGLINPVVITPVYELISGFRRIRAARELGWKYIDARIMEPDSQLDFLEMEMHENIIRKDFTVDELREGLAKKKKLLNPNIFMRVWNFIKKLIGLR